MLEWTNLGPYGPIVTEIIINALFFLLDKRGEKKEAEALKEFLKNSNEDLKNRLGQIEKKLSKLEYLSEPMLAGVLKELGIYFISQLPDVAKQIEGFAENKEQLVKLKEKIDEGMKEATDIRKKYSDEIVQAWIQPIEEERFYNTLTSMSVIASGTTAYTSMKPELPPGWQIKKAVDTDICPRCGSHLYRYMYDMACRNCRWPWR